MRRMVLLALVCAFSLAQALELPAGWQRRHDGNATVFTPQDSAGKTYFLMAFDPLPSGGIAAQEWLPAVAAKLSAGYGNVLDRGEVRGEAGIATLAQRIDVAGKTVQALYTAFARDGDEMQLLLLLSEEDAALFAAHQEQSQAIMAALYAQAQGKDAQGKVAPSGNGEWRSAPGAGVQADAIEALLHHGDLEYVGIDLHFVETQTLLLKDGSAYTNLKVPPADLDLATARQHDAAHWTRWRKTGDGYDIETDGAWQKAPGSAVRAATAGETLNGTYTYSAASGNVYSGGRVYFHYLTFHRDGSYEDSDYQIAGQSNVNSSITVSPHGTTASVATGNGSVHLADTRQEKTADKGGRYQLDGHTLILTRDDGSRERLLFFFWAEDDENLSIGGKTYTRGGK
ncbi:MAG: hypothetical protein Q4D61_05680 [Cardiobacteriaceae bacterium]|nr:hypothetical protein [Cardiobacteriaceae bacterium]